jgi:two-component system, NtrC family, sensor kinase
MESPHWKILLVEDDEDDYLLTLDLLSEAKGNAFELLWASTYEKALDALQIENLDAILVDYQLGSYTGLDYVREAVSRNCQSPLIVLTGQGNYEVDLQAMQVGAVDYLIKAQLNPGLLERTIRYAIERTHAQDALKKAHDELEQRVQERTKELVKANQELQNEIAERRRVEAHMKVLTKALESADTGIFITDQQGKIMWSNPAFSRMTGFTPQQVFNQNPRFLSSGRHDNEFYEGLWETIKSGKVWRGEMINRRSDNTLYIEEQTITPVKDDRGVISHFISIKQDITERKQAENLIRQNAVRAGTLAEMSRALVEAGPDYQAILDVVARYTTDLIGDGCLIFVPAEGRQPVNYNAFFHIQPEAIGILDQIMDLSIPTQEGILADVFRSGRPVLHEVCTEKQSRLLLPMPEFSAYLQRFGVASAIGVPLRTHGSVIGALALFRDLPGRAYTVEDEFLLQSLADRAALAIANARLYKDLETALQEEQSMRRQLVQAEKHSAMSRMVASVAHELNNPIQTIQNCLFLIQQDLPADPTEQNFIQMALSESRRMSNLVTQLREIYRPSKVEPLAPLDIGITVEEVHALLSPHLQHENVVWQTEKFTSPIMIAGIADQIKQVFLNICLNAVEAMQPDGGTLKIQVQVDESENLVGVSIKDTGPGISPENLNQVFEPFFTTKDYGTGLGLSICYDIIERHGGEIDLSSEPGQGADFTVWLPLLSEGPVDPNQGSQRQVQTAQIS